MAQWVMDSYSWHQLSHIFQFEGFESVCISALGSVVLGLAQLVRLLVSSGLVLTVNQCPVVTVLTAPWSFLGGAGCSINE